MILWMSLGHKIAHRYSLYREIPVDSACECDSSLINLGSVYQVHGVTATFCASSKYVGEGMSAAVTGLALGGIILVLSGILLDGDLTQQLLTFNHSNFFV